MKTFTVSESEFISLVEQVGGEFIYEYEEIENSNDFLIIINLIDLRDKLIITFDQRIDKNEAYDFFREKHGYNIGLDSFLEYVRENRILREELSEHFFEKIKITKP